MIAISRRSDAVSSYEYGCDLRRLFPWPGVGDPLWGAAVASVRPSEATTAHSHDEEEAFLVLRGHGTITIDDVSEKVSAGDLIYLPRHSHHSMRNDSDDDRLEFLTIFWGSREANLRMIEMAAALAAKLEPPRTVEVLIAE